VHWNRVAVAPQTYIIITVHWQWRLCFHVIMRRCRPKVVTVDRRRRGWMIFDGATTAKNGSVRQKNQTTTRVRAVGLRMDNAKGLESCEIRGHWVIDLRILKTGLKSSFSVIRATRRFSGQIKSAKWWNGIDNRQYVSPLLG